MEGKKLISKRILAIAKVALILGHYIFLNVPCKWNMKKKRFKTVRSRLYTLILLIHIARWIISPLIIALYTWIFIEQMSYMDLCTFSFLAMSSTAAAIIHILFYQDKSIIADVFNFVIEIIYRHGKQETAIAENNKS